MPIYTLTMSYIDSRNGVTDKAFTGEFADFATARTSAASFVTAAQAITGAGVFKWSLAEENFEANSPTAGSRVTDRMSATLFLDQSTNKKANFLMPAPAAAILSGNTLNQTAAWNTYIDFMTTPLWQISDGEHVDESGGAGTGTVSGKLISVRSGVRTLPTG